MPKTAASPLPMEHPLTTHAVPSLMDDLQFMAAIETMETVPAAPVPPVQLFERVRTMEDEFVPKQTRLHLHASELSRIEGPRVVMRDRNAFQPAPLEPDEEFEQRQNDDETSVTISARVAAFAITASGLAGAGAAALVFHARLAQFLQ